MCVCERETQEACSNFGSFVTLHVQCLFVWFFCFLLFWDVLLFGCAARHAGS